jgi:clan AA aspartic protease (TIGR02281 family)
MKTIINVAIAIGATVLTPLAVNPQEYSGCFLENATGQTIDLGNVCANNIAKTQSAPNGTFRVPIKRRDGGIPVIEVTFNGRQRFEMLLDTGASATTISSKMAKKIGIDIDRQISIATAGGVVKAGISNVASVQAGGMVVKDINVIVSPHTTIGLLGQDFLGDRDITITDKVVELRIRQR